MSLLSITSQYHHNNKQVLRMAHSNINSLIITNTYLQKTNSTCCFNDSLRTPFPTIQFRDVENIQLNSKQIALIICFGLITITGIIRNTLIIYIYGFVTTKPLRKFERLVFYFSSSWSYSIDYKSKS